MVLNVNIPMTGKPSDISYNVVEVQQRLGRLQGQYGTAFEQAYRLNNLPALLLAGIVLVENFQVDPDSVHRNSTRLQDAVGLGQHKVFSATDVLIKARQKQLLTPEKRLVFIKRLGSRLAKIDTLGLGGGYIVTQDDLKDAEFNLMLTALYLSVLVAESVDTTTHLVRLDKVSYRYNQGYYAKLPKPSTNTEELLDGLAGEGRRYVLRMVGRGGMLASLS